MKKDRSLTLWVLSIAALVLVGLPLFAEAVGTLRQFWCTPKAINSFDRMNALEARLAAVEVQLEEVSPDAGR